MGEIQSALDRETKITIAHLDGLSTIAKIIPYLRERKESADRIINGIYNEEGQKACFDHIEFCNKKIAIILGITTEPLK